MQPIKKHIVTAFLCAAALASVARADIVETKDGARLVGKVSGISGGTVTLSTTYAGDISIKQSEVTAITTDGPIAVRLASGTRIDGKIASTGGKLEVIGQDGTVTTTVDKVAASWTAGGEDPQIIAMRRKWTLQTAVDISGNSGNTTSTTIGASFVAALVSPQDALKFYGSHNYGTTTANGVKTKSADDTKVGVDYSSFFDPRYGWFARSELERDAVAGVDLRSTTDFGGTMRFIKSDIQSLVGRLGAGYRFESYASGAPTSKGAVLSTGLHYKLEISHYASLDSDIQYLPSFDNFSDYRIQHDSGIQMPISNSFWMLRVGVSNSYTSRPQPGRKSLDTMYYTRLMLNWR
ncbi:hypothetical protein GALL_127380 [mine drainage metagenome]|uniref:DUF481 domain-containing protein n=1 Tax=mine drainage metagenome TaxID=410659 RepID=A0A1J5SU84_9ZZZZ